MSTDTIYITKTTIAQTGERAWEAEWFTDQRMGTGHNEGIRVITLTASHRSGYFVVTAGISTALAHDHFKVRQYRMFVDPLVTLTKQRARFSQKRLKEMFDGFYDHFDAEEFYAAHEVDF